MIAAGVVAFGEIDKFPANARRTGQAGEARSRPAISR
jgi:hypothetical protein